MTNSVQSQTGWKPMPLALKVLFVVMILWTVGSVMNLPNLMTNGVPLLGTFVDGPRAFLMVLCLDIIGPLVFLYALWFRKHWAVKWAFFYIGLFILNGLVALFTLSDQLGLAQIAIPNLVSLAFLAVIYWNRSYVARTG